MATLVAAALMATAVVAQSEQQQIEDLRSQREALARNAAEVATQIDALLADDDALVDALADLDEFIELQQSRIAAAAASIQAAEAEALAARAEADWLVQEIEDIRERLRERAIDAFVKPPADIVEQLANSDLNQNAVRLFLIDVTLGSELEITDELRTAEAQLDAVRLRAVSRAEAADREREAQEDRLEELREARAVAEGYRAEIQRRIDEWNREAAELDRIDREMEREIWAIEESIRRAAEERRRQEEEARRQAIEDERRAHEAEHGPFEFVAWPADGGLTSTFGPRVHPILGGVRQHQGIDIDGDTGDRIRAARSGEVILAERRGGYGNTIVIYHGLGYSSLYAHLSQISVSVGEQVSSGDRIGSMGSTGLSTGPHLHFELRIDGTAVDPLPYLP